MAAYLARFKGQSRIHTESDLRGYLIGCEARRLDPLAATTRPHNELYLRWLQEVRRYRPSTASRRMSVVAGSYRTCVIDSVLEHSAAEYVRRPNVPAGSPTPGLHLQFEALLTAAKHSTNSCDFALVCATRRLRPLAEDARVRLPRMHPHVLRHTFVTTMLDAGVDLRDVQIARPPRRPTHHHALRRRPIETARTWPSRHAACGAR